MTEKEAKTKWCPMVRHEADAPSGGSWNRGFTTPTNTDNGVGAGFNCTCIASDCMMWRTRKNNRDEVIEVITGYCGLAGNQNGSK